MLGIFDVFINVVFCRIALQRVQVAIEMVNDGICRNQDTSRNDEIPANIYTNGRAVLVISRMGTRERGVR